MNVVIVGCGRAGGSLAAVLDAEGDDVAVVDREASARDRLPQGFRGRFVEGDALRKDVLEAAGARDAAALVALSSNDSLNVVVARVARDVYHVPQVLGRLHDADRAPVCVELGLPMVTSARMIVDRVHRMVRHARLEPEQTFGNGESLLVRSTVPDYLDGRGVSELNVAGEIQVVEVTRAGRSSIPGGGETLRRGDLVSFVVAASALGRLRGFLGGRWA